MTRINTNGIRQIAWLIALSVGFFTIGLAEEALAQNKGKSVQTEVIFVGYDPAAKTITAKVRKTGRKVPEKEAELKNGQEASFNVKPEGSVLTRTTVSINGKKGELTDLEAGKTLNIYWIVDETQPTKRFARKIDLLLSEAEITAREAKD